MVIQSKFNTFSFTLSLRLVVYIFERLCDYKVILQIITRLKMNNVCKVDIINIEHPNTTYSESKQSLSSTLCQTKLEEIYSRTAVSQSSSFSFSLPVPCIPNRGRPFSPSILSTRPAFPTTTIGLRPSVCLLWDHCPEGALCLSLLPLLIFLSPPSIPLSHAPWSIWTRRERGDLSVKAGGGKWRLRWRRHALYIKCSDPCEVRRGDSRWGYINRLLLKER